LTNEEVLLLELPQSFQQAIQKEEAAGTFDEITRKLDGNDTFTMWI